MIRTHSDDPNVALAAGHAATIITETLQKLTTADSFDYGGHDLKIGEYEVCATCTQPIAEAQQANAALLAQADELDDPVVAEHLRLAAQLFKIEAEAAIIRAEFHNGHGTEPILNTILGFLYDRGVRDEYDHNHAAGNQS
jgi:hypothetical protein